MLKNPRYAGVNFHTGQFEQLVQEEMRKHKVRAEPPYRSEVNVENERPGPGWSQTGGSFKSPLSPPTPSAATAEVRPRTKIGQLVDASDPNKQLLEEGVAADNDTLPHAFTTSEGKSSSRVSDGTRTYRTEVRSFFDTLKAEEEAQIARYHAEHGLREEDARPSQG